MRETASRRIKLILREHEAFRDIGQNVLVKTAVTVEFSMAAAVLSCFKQDTGWTKRVGKNPGKP